MYERTLAIRARQIPYFRTEQFSQVMSDCDFRLKNLIGTENNSSIMYLGASGTGAMEAAVINIIKPGARVLVVNGGVFGARFVQICSVHGFVVDELIVPVYSDLKSEDFNKSKFNKYDAVLVNLHETSIGKLYSISIISDFCKENGAILMVDAITTFMCEEYRMDEWGVDVTILSSHKGLCLSPGLSMVVLNNKMKKNIILNSSKLYFDFALYLEDIKRFQTPFTPPVGILLELQDMLHFIEEFGSKNWFDRVEKRASYFRKLVDQDVVDMPTYSMSNSITPMYLKYGGAVNLFNYLRDECDFIVNPSGGNYRDNMIRVSHIGNVELSDYNDLWGSMSDFFRINKTV